MFGLPEHGQKPHDDVLNNGLACVECAAAVFWQLPRVPGFVDA